MELEDATMIGIRSDLDGPEVRSALHVGFGPAAYRVPGCGRHPDALQVAVGGRGARPNRRASGDGGEPGRALGHPGPDAKRNGLVP
jgi:hypothetical protein